MRSVAFACLPFIELRAMPVIEICLGDKAVILFRCPSVFDPFTDQLSQLLMRHQNTLFLATRSSFHRSYDAKITDSLRHARVFEMIAAKFTKDSRSIKSKTLGNDIHADLSYAPSLDLPSSFPLGSAAYRVFSSCLLLSANRLLSLKSCKSG